MWNITSVVQLTCRSSWAARASCSSICLRLSLARESYILVLQWQKTFPKVKHDINKWKMTHISENNGTCLQFFDPYLSLETWHTVKEGKIIVCIQIKHRGFKFWCDIILQHPTWQLHTSLNLNVLDTKWQWSGMQFVVNTVRDKIPRLTKNY